LRIIRLGWISQEAYPISSTYDLIHNINYCIRNKFDCLLGYYTVWNRPVGNRCCFLHGTFELIFIFIQVYLFLKLPWSYRLVRDIVDQDDDVCLLWRPNYGEILGNNWATDQSETCHTYSPIFLGRDSFHRRIFEYLHQLWGSYPSPFALGRTL